MSFYQISVNNFIRIQNCKCNHNKKLHSKCFSKLDIQSEYQQIRMWHDDVHKTALMTHHRYYQFLLIPFSCPKLLPLSKPWCMSSFNLIFFGKICDCFLKCHTCLYSHHDYSHLQPRICFSMSALKSILLRIQWVAYARRHLDLVERKNRPMFSS